MTAMVNLVSKTRYNAGERLILAGIGQLVKTVVVKSGQGEIVEGDVLKFDSTPTFKFVKYAGSGNIIAVALTGGDATSQDITVQVIVKGAVNSLELKGIDYLQVQIDTPATPTTVLGADGTLTAVTHEYKLVAKGNGGVTAPSGASIAVTPHVAVGGYASGNTYANIAAINTALGNCSVTPKVITLLIDGVNTPYSFTADYSGAGAFATFAAFAAAMVFAGATTATPTASTPVKVTSNTTGITSLVTVVSDTTGLFSTKIEVAGKPIEKKVNITIVKDIMATGYRLWRSIGGAAYTYRDVIASEYDAGLIVDDGSLTWTAGTLTTATDIAGLQSMFVAGIYPSELTAGYELTRFD